MAPRTAKAKKAADVKVVENDAPKKGRGKAKNTEETEQEVPEVEIDEKPALTEKKAKRGKKTQENGDSQTNGTSEDAAPPTKRGRKKKEAEPEETAPEEKASNGDADEQTPAAEEEHNGDHTEANDTEDAQPAATGKGRKKPAKKEEKPKETAKGRKAKQASPDEDEKEEKVAEEKPKGKGRGRKPKAEAAPEPEEEEKTEPAEEAKAEPAAKGRRKAQGKAVKDISPEPEELTEETEKQDEPEEKPEAPKKEAKGRKGKKAQAKDEGESEEKEPASKKRKVTKKEEKGQGDTKEEEVAEDAQEEEAEEPKPAKGKRGKKEAPVAPTVDADEESADSEASSKRRRKPADEKAPTEDSKKKAPAKNKTATNYDEIDFSNQSKNPQGKEWNFKISCWNVDGIRAWMNKGGLEYIKYEKPDILCLQETKCSKDKLPEELANLPGYHAYWVDSNKDGYAGVGLYTSRLAMNVQYGLNNKELDDEGRIITAEYEQFYLICTYVPNAGRKLVTLPRRLQWNEAFKTFVKELDKKKPVIICGDMNVAHNEIDLANPKTNRKNAGFTAEERAGMTELLGAGFVDTFRHFYPDHTAAYTFWTYMMNARAKNVGWRLDYFIVSERLLPAVCDNVIRSEVYGSDHCPITLFLNITTADKPKEA